MNSENYTRITALSRNPFLITGGEFQPGFADSFCESISDEKQKAICQSELLYYRGYPEQAQRNFRRYDMKNSAENLVAGYLIDTVTAIPLGKVERIEVVNGLLSATEKAKYLSDADRKSFDFARLFVNILVRDEKNIKLPDVSVRAFAVPRGLLPYAVYAYAHYLILCGDYGRAVGIAEGTLINIIDSNPIGEIYLCLVISIGYICRKEWNKAEYYFRHAWKCALPDSLFMPFVENRILLSGLVEKYIKKDYQKEYKKIAALSSTYYNNWVYIHNKITGENITNKLTSSEMNVAILVTRGYSNTEISEFVGIAVNSVRAHLRNIFVKLNITSRKELCNYLMK